MSTIPPGKVRRTRDDHHGWRVWHDDTRIGYVTQNSSTWTAKDRRGQPIRRGIERLDTAVHLVVGRHLELVDANPDVTRLSDELHRVAVQRVDVIARRDQLVAELSDAGARLETIAAAAHISVSGVREVLRRMGRVID